MRKCGLILLLAALGALAQKKPITLNALEERARGRGGDVVWSPDAKSFAYRSEGSLMVYRTATHNPRAVVKISELSAAAMRSSGEPAAFDWTDRHQETNELQWTPDSGALLYEAGGDIFLVQVANGHWEQLTRTTAEEIDPQLSPDGKKVVFRRGWDLYTVEVNGHKENRLTSGGSDTLRNGGLDWVYPEEIGLERAFWWSPDSKSVAYVQFDIAQEPVYPHEDLLHPRAVFEPQHYPQAGENNATVRLGVVPAGGGKTRWLEIGDTRDAYLIARVGWMPDSRSVYVVRTNRVQNRLEALAIHADSGAASTLFQESDPYWINTRGDLEFLRDGHRFLWTSERDGYRHIFLYSMDGKKVEQLTRGAWEVTEIVGVDNAAGRVFYVSGEASPLERQLYAIGLDGQNKQRLTPEAGTHEITMAPEGAYYLDKYSSLTTPPRTVLHTGGGESVSVFRDVENRDTEYDVRAPEIVQFPGADGTMLYGSMLKPAGFQAGQKYPVVVEVYGGPDIELPVRNRWPAIDLDQVLAQKGYIVWRAENRGGAGRGHAFETAIFHKLGVNELADQLAGVRYLISQGMADPQRIGIQGWSYGGFMTVNAMLNAPGVFRAGIAGAPVTSWLNYDTIYTERYMGIPKENAQGYRETALPQHAEKLQGKLLLVHNVEDDNVLIQNTMQLSAALQAAGRQFEMMLYPQKSHHVSGSQLKQMNAMMVDFFERNLK
jgi:dipeptidyl-peptidase-4